MSNNSTSETKISKYYTNDWKEIENKWLSYGILKEDSINNLLLDLEVPECFSKVKKILHSYIMDERRVMIYLTIFMEPHLKWEQILDKIKPGLSDKKIEKPTLNTFLSKMVFEKIIIVTKKGGRTQLYEPGFGLYSIIKDAVHNGRLYDNWVFNTGKALFFLFEKGDKKETPKIKILLEKVQPNNTRFDNQYIFPAILVDDFDEVIRSKKEMVEMFEIVGDTSFVADQCNLVPILKFPLMSESNFLAELFEVHDKMKSKVEQLVRDVKKFDKITKLPVDAAPYVSYDDAFSNKRDNLNHRVLFYVAIKLCLYYESNNRHEAAVDVITKTLKIMNRQDFDNILKENSKIKEDLKEIIKDADESAKKS